MGCFTYLLPILLNVICLLSNSHQRNFIYHFSINVYAVSLLFSKNIDQLHYVNHIVRRSLFKVSESRKTGRWEPNWPEKSLPNLSINLLSFWITDSTRLLWPASCCSHPQNLIIQTSSTFTFDYISGGFYVQKMVLKWNISSIFWVSHAVIIHAH